MSFTIDCESCPVRGRRCGDCFVPVLATAWLEEPRARPQVAPGSQERPATMPLDFEETEAVEAFVRAGLISRADAQRVRAQNSTPATAVG